MTLPFRNKTAANSGPPRLRANCRKAATGKTGSDTRDTKFACADCRSRFRTIGSRFSNAEETGSGIRPNFRRGWKSSRDKAGQCVLPQQQQQQRRFSAGDERPATYLLSDLVREAGSDRPESATFGNALQKLSAETNVQQRQPHCRNSPLDLIKNARGCYVRHRNEQAVDLVGNKPCHDQPQRVSPVFKHAQPRLTPCSRVNRMPR